MHAPTAAGTQPCLPDTAGAYATIAMGGWRQISNGGVHVHHMRYVGVDRGKAAGTDLDELKCGGEACHMHTCMPSRCHQGYGSLAANTRR